MNLEQIIAICGRGQFQSGNILSNRLRDRIDVPSHAGLAWDASGDDDDVGASEGLLEAVIRGEVARDFRGGRNVRDIGRDTGGVDDIEQAELSQLKHASVWAGWEIVDRAQSRGEGAYLGDERVQLEEEGEGLANATCMSPGPGHCTRSR